ncbi:Imm51 family immunity protein [Wohlfahrtiimonas populi]|uniref:Imm51 family immunity protein n=1 Tax=Wohlfahrtiimonas populi TaxID=1940240 RepID=UPI00098D2B86|nr:Imm51 family immunity protein [Wohlfahrtiimonas populi]
MTESIKPFHFLIHDDGKSSFFFMSDAFYNDPIMDILEAQTGTSRDYFNGYAWQKVVAKFIEESFSESAHLIEFDPEADMFSAISTDVELLKTVAIEFQAFLKINLAKVSRY